MPLGKETTCEGRARHRSLGSGWEIGEEVSSFVYARGLSHFSGVRLHATLWTVAHQAFLSMGFSRQEDWGGRPCPLPRDRPNLGLNLPFLHCRRIRCCSASRQVQQDFLIPPSQP